MSDDVGCTTVNGDSHSVDSVVMSSDTVVSAADVSDGDVGVQQQHSNAVGADAPAQVRINDVSIDTSDDTLAQVRINNVLVTVCHY